MKSDSGVAGIKTLSVFGLGKLGSVVAACHAARGFQVIGVDPNPDFVESVARGVAPVREPQLDELFEHNRERLRATTDGSRAVLESDATLMVVPTPSRSDGSYSLRFVEEACRVVGNALRRKDSYHLVVLKSTVLPGDSEEHIVPALERASGKRCGSDFGFCYNPEFIALGSVVRNIFEPDLVLVGESDSRAGDLLTAIYGALHGDAGKPLARMTFVNAELAKLAVNTYVTLKITYANSLARLCEELPGGNVGTVTAALGLDSRIGSRYLGGGLGFGGPCFPRDNKALLSLARKAGVPFALAETTDAENPAFTERVAERMEADLPRGARVAVLGLGYKPNTPVVEESQALALAGRLSDRFAVIAYDPLAMDNARAALGSRVAYAESARACTEGADAVVVATPWSEFAEVAAEAASNGRGTRVFDCWGLLRGRELRNSWTLGVYDQHSDSVSPERKRATAPQAATDTRRPKPRGDSAQWSRSALPADRSRAGTA